MSIFNSFRIVPKDVNQHQRFDMKTNVNKNCFVKYEIRGQAVKFEGEKQSFIKELVKGRNSFEESISGESGIVGIFAVNTDDTDDTRYYEINLL